VFCLIFLFLSFSVRVVTWALWAKADTVAAARVEVV
jgi:hypothetical protein